MIANNNFGTVEEQAYMRVRDKLRDAFDAGQSGKPFDAELSTLCGENALFADMAEKQRLAGSKAPRAIPLIIIADSKASCR